MKYLFWLIPLILFLLQLLMTLNSFNQIRFEELIESVQAPLWFDQGLVIAGTHTNIGWYAFLLAIYKIFGFSINTAKFALLGISLVSLFSLAILIRKFFTPIPGAIILLTVGLSPTLMFYTTQNLHLGVGLQMIPIFILIMMLLDFTKRRTSFIQEAFIFALAMTILLFYPSFMFYLPSLGLFYLLKLRKHFSLRHILVVITAFLLPAVAGFIYVENKQILVLDAQTESGLFRGGAKISFTEETFSQAWIGLFRDLFIKAGSYHFEVAKVDFSDLYPIITVLFVLYIIWQTFKQVRKSRPYILLILLVAGFNLVILSITSDYGIPAMKRSTPILASIYMFWVISWYHLIKNKLKLPWPKGVSFLILSLLTIHHLIVYPINLTHIKDPSPFKVTDWFDEQNPQNSVDMLVKAAQKEDLSLDCRPLVEKFGGCSYDFIYSAVAASCKWNNLDCHQILGYDSKTGQFIPLSLDLWLNNYFEHQ